MKASLRWNGGKDIEHEEGEKRQSLTQKANFVQGMETNHIVPYSWVMISIYILIAHILSIDPNEMMVENYWEIEEGKKYVCVPMVGYETELRSPSPTGKSTDDF